jgi:putative peptidoglycan lipid II flippase
VGAMTAALALGVPAFVLTEPLARSFYARGETHLPVWFNAAGVGLMVGLMAGLTLGLEPSGERALEVIGWSTAAGAWLGVAVGFALLARRVKEWPLREDLAASSLSLLRAGAMGVVVFGVLTWTDLGAASGASLGVVTGLVTYAVLSLRSAELRRTMDLVRRGS